MFILKGNKILMFIPVKNRVMSTFIFKNYILKRALTFCKHLKCLRNLHSSWCGFKLHICFKKCIKTTTHENPQGFSTLEYEPRWLTQKETFCLRFWIFLQRDMIVSYKWGICQPKVRPLVASSTLKNSHCYY